MLDQLQKIGKALMLPIAVLPAAALLLRFGVLLSGDLKVADGTALTVVWNVMTIAGDAVFGNLALLFAIGVAMTPWDKLMAALHPANLVTIVATVVTLMTTGWFVGKWVKLYPIEAAIVNACLLLLMLQSGMLLVGFYSRVQAASIFFWLVSFQNRNPLILDGEDTVFRIFAFKRPSKCRTNVENPAPGLASSPFLPSCLCSDCWAFRSWAFRA